MTILVPKRVTMLLMMVEKMLLLIRDMVILVLMRVIMLLVMARQTCFVGICPRAKHHLSATTLKHFNAHGTDQHNALHIAHINAMQYILVP